MMGRVEWVVSKIRGSYSHLVEKTLRERTAGREAEKMDDSSGFRFSFVGGIRPCIQSCYLLTC